ncbi:hypothetical protein AB751O23_AO_00010, partial [Chlamydiales bacterium SCGC AB-751-O23]
AKKGVIEAQERYGWMCFKGEGGEKNVKAAAVFFKMARKNGSVNAIYGHASVLYEKAKLKGERSFYKASAQCFKRFLESSTAVSFKERVDSWESLISIYNFLGEEGGCSLCQASLNQEKEKKAENLRGLMEKISAGNQEVLFDCAERLLGEDEGVGSYALEIKKHLELSVEKRNGKAMFLYAKILLEGEGGAQELRKARFLFGKLARKGHFGAQGYYGLMCYQGIGGEQDYKKAEAYLKKSADKGNSTSQNTLALMYHYGLGVDKDLEEAGSYFVRAAKQGDVNEVYLIFYNNEDSEFSDEDPEPDDESSDFVEGDSYDSR